MGLLPHSRVNRSHLTSNLGRPEQSGLLGYYLQCDLSVHTFVRTSFSGWDVANNGSRRATLDLGEDGPKTIFMKEVMANWESESKRCHRTWKH